MRPAFTAGAVLLEKGKGKRMPWGGEKRKRKADPFMKMRTHYRIALLVFESLFFFFLARLDFI